MKFPKKILTEDLYIAKCEWELAGYSWDIEPSPKAECDKAIIMIYLWDARRGLEGLCAEYCLEGDAWNLIS